ncbi:MAG: hypothetical protein B6242_00895 [Anaerolineaceae bacterium 4572_78]|nr:MAG: hypothetical protein B6242_00895 [Anaerolineaceae bacterium 4572_78]
MQTLHFDEKVNSNGIVTLAGLPPLAQVAIVVINTESLDLQEIVQQWITKMKEHPFSQMSREGILEQLRQSREKIYEEDYGYRHAN